MPEVFVSTGAFKPQALGEILDAAATLGIRHIELSSGVAAAPDLVNIVMERRHAFRFLVHNYFPPAARPFLLNLASPSEEIGARSMAMCRAAVDLCAAVGAPFYSVHCGFTFDAVDGACLGNAKQLTLPRISMDEAMAHFIRRITALCRYGESKGVDIAVENNVIAAFGLLDGGNQLCLGADLEGLSAIFDQVADDALRLLFDVGHAMVNQNTIAADMGVIMDTFAELIVAVHVSDNDGHSDENRPLSEGSSILETINRFRVPFVLESYGLTGEKIVEQVNLLASAGRYNES
jgi:sugar phosphate isomerase/epimerase